MSEHAMPLKNRPCLRRLARLSAYLDRELPRSSCDEIRRHMASCQDCHIILKTLIQTVKLCRQMPTRPASRAALNRVRAAIKRELARQRPPES